MVHVYEITGSTGEKLAKRILFLAWEASNVVGMGILADRGRQDEEVVWKHANQTDQGSCYADYVLGRMMKLYFKFGPTTVSFSDESWRRDYQSFCHKYKDFSNLISAAAKSLGCQVKKPIETLR